MYIEYPIKNKEREYSIWGPMYRVGAVAAIIMTVFIPLQVIVYILQPPPDSVEGWFMLFQKSRLVGLLDMDLLLIVDRVLMGLIVLALCIALLVTAIVMLKSPFFGKAVAHRG
jgi:hypothetical protein